MDNAQAFAIGIAATIAAVCAYTLNKKIEKVASAVAEQRISKDLGEPKIWEPPPVKVILIKEDEDVKESV